MNEIPLQPQDVMRSSHVKRWHMVDTLKSQSLAEHAFNVASYAAFLADRRGTPKKEVLWAALYHDISEVMTGDLVPVLKRVIKYDDPIEAKLTYMGEPTATKNEEIHEIVKLADMVDAVHFLHLYGVGKHAEEIRGKMLASITDPDALDLLEMLLRGEPTTLEEVV